MNILDDIGVSKLSGNVYSGSELFCLICVCVCGGVRACVCVFNLEYNDNALLTKLQQIQSESDMEEFFQTAVCCKIDATHFHCPLWLNWSWHD